MLPQVSGPTHSFAVDSDSDLISFCQCGCGWCSEILNSVINMEQGSSKRKPIPPGGGSRDALDVPTLTDVTTRPPMIVAIGAEKLGAEVSCPSEASPQDASRTFFPANSRRLADFEFAKRDAGITGD